MNMVKATRRFEEWLRRRTAIVEPDLRTKHKHMAEAAFPFLRATFYRWIQVWPGVCSDLAKAPKVLAVGDLHIENFGTWRDAEGRLIWGVNDFDEAAELPYTNDLLRLATSAILAAEEGHLALKPKEACNAILDGYGKSLAEHGGAFVLEEEHKWLRQIATGELRDPVPFWKKMDGLPEVKSAIPASAREALEHLLPAPDSELSSGSPSSWFGKPWACSAGGAHGNLWRQDRARGQGACAFFSLLGERERGSDGNFVPGNYESCRASARSFCTSTRTMDCAAPLAALFAH